MKATLSRKQPSAFLPVAMSLAAVAAVRVLILAFFAIQWLPRAPRRALRIPALQGGAALAPDFVLAR